MILLVILIKDLGNVFFGVGGKKEAAQSAGLKAGNGVARNDVSAQFHQAIVESFVFDGRKDVDVSFVQLKESAVEVVVGVTGAAAGGL